MSLIKYAERELKREGNKEVFELLELFSKQGHSGGSASFVLPVFYRLARHMPLSPLTGEDDEWLEVESQPEYMTHQNKRWSELFKDKNGEAYYYDKKGKRKVVTFPYDVK